MHKLFLQDKIEKKKAEWCSPVNLSFTCKKWGKSEQQNKAKIKSKLRAVRPGLALQLTATAVENKPTFRSTTKLLRKMWTLASFQNTHAFSIDTLSFRHIFSLNTRLHVHITFHCWQFTHFMFMGSKNFAFLISKNRKKLIHFSNCAIVILSKFNFLLISVGKSIIYVSVLINNVRAVDHGEFYLKQ